MFKTIKEKFNKNLLFISTLALTFITILEITVRHRCVFLKPFMFFAYVIAILYVFNYLQTVFNKQKETYISTITHDLTVPIQSQIRTLNHILKNSQDNEENKELMHLLLESNESMEAILNTIISTYKLEEKELLLNFSKVEVNNLLRIVIQELNYDYPYQKILYNFDGTIYESLLDGNLIIKALKNIMTFCLDNSESYRDIYCKIYPYKKERICIELYFYNQYLKLDTIKNMLKKFSTAKEKISKIGTSINLYLSNLIVKLHNGSVKVEKDEDNKITFKIILKNYEFMHF